MLSFDHIILLTRIWVGDPVNKPELWKIWTKEFKLTTTI